MKEEKEGRIEEECQRRRKSNIGGEYWQRRKKSDRRNIGEVIRLNSGEGRRELLVKERRENGEEKEGH